jgi:hypothetical protein
VTAVTALDENLRARADVAGETRGSDYVIPLPSESIYVVVALRPR